MRLTDDILRASDESKAEVIANAYVLAAAGRFGLLPAKHPFELSMNIGKGVLDVESLSCLATTRGGDIIDAHFDTRYNNTFHTRVVIPDTPGVEEYILTINTTPGQWKEVPNGFEEPEYTFALIAPETAVPDNAVPIGHIVDDQGWRMDDVDFVPPCLFVASHWKYEELLRRFADALSTLDNKARATLNAGSREVIAMFWPLIQQLRIAADKERELMTPMTLLSQVQKCVSAFTCAADIYDALDVAEAKMYHSFVLAPYNYKEAYQRIKVGLNICFAISEKVEQLAGRVPPKPEPQPQPRKPRQQKPLSTEPSRPEPPILPDASSTVICKSPKTELKVMYSNRNANIFFTIDGKEPTQKSLKATKSPTGFKIAFNNGFKGGKTEPDKRMMIKMIAVVGSTCSDTAEYDIILQKSLDFRNLTEI